jgi:hypothetical protein
VKKRILAFFVTVALLLCIVPQLTPTANATDFPYADSVRYGRQVLQNMNNANSLLAVYDALVAGIANTESQINLNSNYPITKNELQTVVDVLRSDYPEFFWMKGYSYSTSGSTIRYVAPSYTMTGAQLENAKAAVEASATLLLTGLEDKSDYEISKLIHNRLAAFMSYQYGNNDQTIYGALVERQAVCAGYARAYQYLMQRAGIPAWYITGSSYRPGSSVPEGHAWTMVCLDGNWYHSDLTWDDQGNLGNIYYAYLNVTTEQIKKDHIIDTFFDNNLPSCTSTSANYFVKEGAILSQFDVDTIVAELSENNLQARLFLDNYTLSQFWNDCRNNINTIISRLGVSVSSYGYRTIGQEVVLYLVGRNATPAPVALSFNTLPGKLTYEGDALDLSGGMLTVHYDDASTKQIAITADMVSGYDPSVSGKQVLTVTYAGCKEYFTIENTAAPAPSALPGDMDGDDNLTNDDVVALRWHVLCPELYPLTADTDLNKDGVLTNEDVVALMWHVLFPDLYPLN